MSLEDDLFGNMHRGHPADEALDDELVDRLLDGALAPDDAPPGLSTVAALVERAAGDASPAELAGGAAVVAAMAAVLPDAGGVPEPRRPSLMQGVVRAKLAAAIVVSAVGVGAAAAAVGTIASPGRADHSGVMEAGAATTVTSPASAPPTTIEVTVPTTPPSTASPATVAAAEEFIVAAAEASVAAPTDPGRAASAHSDSGPSAAKMAQAEVFGLCTALHGTDDKLGPPALAKIKAAAAEAGRSLKNFCELVIAAKKGQHDGDTGDRREAGQREQHGPPDEPGNGRGSGQGSGDGDRGQGQGQGQGNVGSRAGKGGG